MTLNNNVQNAIRTESQINEVVVNDYVLEQTLTMVIAAGTILDLIKKNVFYKKEIDNVKYEKSVNKLKIAIDNLYKKEYPNHQQISLDINPRLFHAIVGAITESAELAQALQDINHECEPDLINISEEFFDLDWYKFIFCDYANITPESMLERGFAKLRARFPNKFNSEDAINRDLVKERAILEGNQNP